MTLSPQRLQKLEVVAKAATPGTWTIEPPGKDKDGWSLGVLIAATARGKSHRVYATPEGGTSPFNDAKFIAAFDPPTALALIAMAKEAAGLRALVHVPGLWRCPKCALKLVASLLHVGDGHIAADTEPQECANGCGPMWRVSEREERQEAQRGHNEQFDELSALRDRVAELEGALGGLIATESMVEAAHRANGQPYFNTALDHARAALQQEKGESRR